jgi:hypothetical protein
MTQTVFGHFFSTKTVILAAFTALSLGTIASVAEAASPDKQQGSSYQQGPYDNTGRGPQQTGLEGGGG